MKPIRDLPLTVFFGSGLICCLLALNGCATGGSGGGPITYAQPVSCAAVHNLLPEGAYELVVLPDPNNPKMTMNVFRSSDGQLISVNLLAASQGGFFDGDQLYATDLNNFTIQQFKLNGADRDGTLDNQTYTFYSDMENVSVTEDFGQRERFTINLDKLYQARAHAAMAGNESDYTMLGGTEYATLKQGGPVGCILFFHLPIQSDRPKPDYVVAVAKLTSGGDTVSVGREIPIANTGYMLKQDNPNAPYRVVKGD